MQALSETAAALSVAVAGLGSNGISAGGAEAACLVANVSACAVGGIVSAMAATAISAPAASAPAASATDASAMPGTRPSLPPPPPLHAAETQSEEGSMDRGEAEQKGEPREQPQQEGETEEKGGGGEEMAVETEEEEEEEAEEEEERAGRGEKDIEQELAKALKSGLGWGGAEREDEVGKEEGELEWDLRFTGEFKEQLFELKRQPVRP